MGNGKLILTAIIAAGLAFSYIQCDNISSYFEQQKEVHRKKQERVIPYSDSLLTKSLGTDGINNFYRFNLDERDIAIEVTNRDTLTTKVDSLVIEPENIDLSTGDKKFPIYRIKEKIY